MEQPKLVIASVLKPVTDTRMYEKIGRSIGQTKKYEVNIIGFYRKNLPVELNIKFHPIFNFSRLSLRRFFCGIEYFFKLYKLNPECIICSTHELLIPTVLYSSLRSTKVIYDVQENYYRNILYTDAFPIVFRYPLAIWVRLKEYITQPFIYKYLLAERCYENELVFTKNKSVVIENKLIKSEAESNHQKVRNHKIIQLLFTGTIASTTGVFECIKLTKALHELNASVRLKIVGYCPQRFILNKVLKSINNCDFIELIGGSELVDHNMIVAHIQEADFGLIYYPFNKANNFSIPTKLYEYLGYELPIILENKKIYTQLSDLYPASINIAFTDYSPTKILKEMSRKSFYKIKPKNEILWSSEELKLLSIF